jgi:hypothetical protein
MTWTYTGDPADSLKDEVRFLMGDILDTDPLVQDEEISWAISQQSTTRLAAALILRHLANKFSRLATERIGDISTNCSDLAKAFTDRVKDLDPFDQTLGDSMLVLPSFGGRSISEKETLEDDTDAVQPSFKKGMNDITGGPDEIGTTRSPYKWNI